MFGLVRRKRAAVEAIATPAREMAAFVDPSWLSWPTLTARGGDLKTAGVTHYRKDVERAHRQFGPLVMAELRIESHGPYAGAIRVWVGGLHLGAIPAEAAEAYRGVVQHLKDTERPATCRAILEVGESLDVWLSVRPEERKSDDPFLPPLLGCRLGLEPTAAEYLERDVLGPRARSKRVVQTVTLHQESGTWWATLDGRRLGRLENRTYRWLDQAAASGFPLTCQARILRDSGRPVRVEADFPGHVS